jgi:hypothetical protein|tara:strand:+ start:220 stop:1431 length:1212 start_codon:yes stop_codon:yes gene_type:complete
MPNKTKAKIRHSKLKAKAENAATGSFKKDGGIQKNKRLVTKANKLNKRKNLGLPNIAYGMNKEAYALKPVPEGNKGKGLSKLPTEVRNKMGYQMDSSHSFKGNVANNMKTMYMGSVYYQTQSEEEAEKQKNASNSTSSERVVVGPDGNLKTETTKIDTQDRVVDVFGDVPEKSQGSYADVYSKFEKVDGKAKNPRTGKLYSNLDEFIEDAKANPAGTTKQKIGTKVVQDKVETKDLKDIGREYQSTGNFGRRQQIRGVIQGERKGKRTAIRAARAAADRAGLKGKARREFMREQKGIAKGKQFENQSNRIAEINRQTALQEAQGIIGPGGTIKQGFTPGTLKGNYDVRTDSRQSMNRGVSDFKFKSNLDPSKMNVKMPKANLSLTDMKLSPKAMLHFNRKNKK